MNTRLVRVACLLAGLGTGTALATSKNVNAAQMLRMDEPAFPTSMLVKGVLDGEVQVVISIGSDGSLNDWLLVSYTRREFADSVERALKSSHFQPVMVNGVAAPVRLPLTITFEARGVVVSQTMLDAIDARMDAARGGDHRIQKTTSAKELDSLPVAKHVVSPLYPANVAGEEKGGTVVIDFFIDEKGKVRMPALDGGDKVAYAEAATAALEEWQFEPPTRRGEPVTVRVKQAFVFPPRS